MDYIITQALKEYEESKKPVTITFVKIGKDILPIKKVAYQKTRRINNSIKNIFL